MTAEEAAAHLGPELTAQARAIGAAHRLTPAQLDLIAQVFAESAAAAGDASGHTSAA